MVVVRHKHGRLYREPAIIPSAPRTLFARSLVRAIAALPLFPVRESWLTLALLASGSFLRYERVGKGRAKIAPWVGWSRSLALAVGLLLQKAPLTSYPSG